MEEQASIRSQLYTALAHAFYKPEKLEGDEEDSLVYVLRQAAIAFDAQALGQIVDAVIGSLEIPKYQAEQALHTLEIEYNRLFLWII